MIELVSMSLQSSLIVYFNNLTNKSPTCTIIINSLIVSISWLFLILSPNFFAIGLANSRNYWIRMHLRISQNRLLFLHIWWNNSSTFNLVICNFRPIFRLSFCSLILFLKLFYLQDDFLFAVSLIRFIPKIMNLKTSLIWLFFIIFFMVFQDSCNFKDITFRWLTESTVPNFLCKLN